MKDKGYMINKKTVTFFFVFLFFLFKMINEIKPMLVFDLIAHLCVNASIVVVLLMIIEKSFEKQLPDSIGRIMLFCGITLGAEFLILDAVRFAITGKNTVMLWPACLPISVLIIIHFHSKERGIERKPRNIAYLITLGFLLISLFFEVLSFIE